MLRLIPRQPRRIDAKTIRERLKEAGYDIDVRTVQRDLNKLSQTVPIVADNAKPQGWSWQAGAASLDVAALDAPAALTFKLVEQYLSPLLPQTVLEHLQPWFDTAEGALNTSDNGFARWCDKIRILPAVQPQIPPPVGSDAQAVLYQALLEQRRVVLHYQRRGATAPRDYVVSPLALVVSENVIYIVCTLGERPDVRHLALHRLREARLLNETFAPPDGFDIDQHIAQGAFGFPISGKNLHLEAEFTTRVAGLLQERPLSADQIVVAVNDTRSIVRATVQDTKGLRWWLQGFGTEVRVLGPDFLKEEFRRTAQQLAQMYE
ncbi:helix-turn-helix transcriptional regulator [Noviherbaspirillum saxi]|nr:WYL domain-containing protein [Noviherbaspirillum saxi]